MEVFTSNPPARTPTEPVRAAVVHAALSVLALNIAIDRRLRPDLEAPALSFLASTVIDEGDEFVTFAPDHSPEHVHAGMPVELSAPMACPTLTKFASLLGWTSPEYTLELPGVMQTSWVLDWTSAGTGDPVGTGVSTTEGTYDVELRATDRLGRTTR